MALPVDLLLTHARMVTDDAVVEGWLSIRGGRVEALGAGAPPAGQTVAGEVRDLGGAWLAPGFVDVHVHGGGGSASAAPAWSTR